MFFTLGGDSIAWVCDRGMSVLISLWISLKSLMVRPVVRPGLKYSPRLVPLFKLLLISRIRAPSYVLILSKGNSCNLNHDQLLYHDGHSNPGLTKHPLLHLRCNLLMSSSLLSVARLSPNLDSACAVTIDQSRCERRPLRGRFRHLVRSDSGAASAVCEGGGGALWIEDPPSPGSIAPDNRR